MNEINYILPAAEYHARPGLSATVLKAARKSMLAARHVATVRREPTAAMSFGTLVHLAVLEPHKLADRVAVYDGRRAGKEFDAFAAANSGRTILKPDEMDELAAVRDAVHASTEARAMLGGTFVEASVFWTDPAGEKAKARPDAFHPSGVLVDIKTTSAITPRAFERQAWELGYAIQLGWYRRGLRANDVAVYEANIIAIESAAPHDVVVYRVDDALMDWGEREAVRLAAQYRACGHAGRYPGVSAARLALGAPAWAADDVAAVPPAETVDASDLF